MPLALLLALLRGGACEGPCAECRWTLTRSLRMVCPSSAQPVADLAVSRTAVRPCW
jgi:hypothetical protein